MKMKKRISLMLALVMMASLALPAQAAEGGGKLRPAAPAETPAPVTVPAPAPQSVDPASGEGYSDTKGHYASRVIDTWSGYGVLKGYEDGTFRPDGTITRAELATVLDRVMGYQDTAENTFADLPAERWYTDYLLRLVQQGIFNGSEDKRMYPETPITRQETFAAMARALALEESDKAPGFKDDGNIADWAKGYVSAMKEAGYIQGDQNGNIRPGEAITRAEVVTILDKMAAGFINVDGTYSEDCKGNLFVNARDVKLKDMSVDGDLIITDGVGDGDVYLENVKVSGTLVIRGGGENSVHIVGDASKYGSIIVTKTASGRIRLVSERGAVIPIINVNDGLDGVIIEGISNTQVVVAGEVEVVFAGNVKSAKVAVNAPGASVKVENGATLASLDVAKTAKDSKVFVEKGAKVTTLTTAAKSTVENNGTVSRLKAEADGVQIDGKKPGSLVVAKGVARPTGTGAKVTVASSGGGSFSSAETTPTPVPDTTPTPAPDTTPTPPPASTETPAPGVTPTPAPEVTPTPTPDVSPTPTPEVTPTPTPEVTPTPEPTYLSEVTVLMDSPRTGVTAVQPSAAGIGYTAAVEWTPALVNGKFAANTAYTAKVTVSPASSGYVFAPSAVDSVEIRKTALNYGATATLGKAVLEDGEMTFTAWYPNTSGTVKIVASLTDGRKVDDTTNSLTLFQDMHAQWLRVDAHLEADGQTIADRPIQYEWSSSSPELGGSGRDYIYPHNSLDWDYTTPAMDLVPSTYNYVCKLSADGCEPMELKYNVTVKDSTGIEFDFSRVHLWNDYDNGLILQFNQEGINNADPNDTITPQYTRYIYTFQRENGTEATLLSGGGPFNHSIDIVQNFYNDLYVSGWYAGDDLKYENELEPIDRMEKVTITNIRLEPMSWARNEEGMRTPVGEPFDYKCNIKFLPQKTQMRADAENALVYDPTKDTLTFNGLSNGQSSDYKKKLTCSFNIDGWRTLSWGVDRQTMSYHFPVASMNVSWLQEKIRGGEQVTAEVRTMAIEAGGEAVWYEPRLGDGEAEVYIEYVEGLKSVVIDSAGV